MGTLTKQRIAVLCVAVGILFGGAARADSVDITALAGYQEIVTSPLNFSDTGWAGWSVQGKVVLGAEIISAGDSFLDFSVFRPFGPGGTTPTGYTYAANEYGFIFRDVANGAGNSNVKIKLFFADIGAVENYTITTSSTLNYSGTGWGGWSAPTGQVVSGGGYAFSNTGSSAGSSQFADNSSVWPHYTFGANEQGWVVQNGGSASPANLYVISFDAPPVVPIPGAAGLGLLGMGIVGYMRRRKNAVA